MQDAYQHESLTFEDQLSMVEQAVDSALSSKKPGSHIAYPRSRKEFIRGMRDVRATAKAIRRSLESPDGYDEETLICNAIRLGRLMVACRVGFYRNNAIERPMPSFVVSFTDEEIGFSGLVTEIEYTHREHIRTGLPDLFEPMELGMKVLLCSDVTTTTTPKKKSRKSRRKSG